MKKCSPALLALLNSAVKLCILDLITFTLQDGTVLRYNAGCYTINVGGNNYTSAALNAGALKQALGTNVDDFTLDWFYNSYDNINGVPIPQILRSGAFDSATVNFSQLFMPTWTISASADYVLSLFTGLMQMDTVGRSKTELHVKAMTDKLNGQIPSLVYQPGCMNLLYNQATCGLNRADYTSASSVKAGSNQLTINCGLTQGSGYFSQGSLQFTSGANTGVIATVKSYTPGQVVLMWPLPFTISVGDTFTIAPGCDRTEPTCINKFNNRAKYRGTPFIPVPDVVV